MKTFPLFTITVAIFIASGCGSPEVAQQSGEAPVTANSDYVATSEPADAVAVGDAKKEAENEQPVTLVGLIGGSSKPFVEGLAAFTIVDEKIPHCAVDEGCPTPWDYCCTQDQVKENIATIKIVDKSGVPVTEDARELLSVNELSTVVVKGKAERDEQGNLTVAATKVYIRPGKSQ